MYQIDNDLARGDTPENIPAVRIALAIGLRGVQDEPVALQVGYEPIQLLRRRLECSGVH